MNKFQYSIKTVDGDRFIYDSDAELAIGLFYVSGNPRFLGFPTKDGAKYFNTANIVSVTERVVEDDS